MERAKKEKLKIIFNMRDPRDRIISYAYKIKKFKPQLKISIKKLSLLVIKYYGLVTYAYLTPTPFYKNLGDFAAYYKLYYPWKNYPDLLTVYFEDLVGPNAGGSLERQIKVIQKISQFLDIQTSDKEAERIAKSLWGGTASFRNPKIGLWKKFFTHEHRRAFKKMGMAQFLIDHGYAQNHAW